MKAEKTKSINKFKIWPHNCTKENQFLIAEKTTSVTSYGKQFTFFKVLKDQRLYNCEFTPNELRKFEPFTN